jgi:hypothetical protein
MRCDSAMGGSFLIPRHGVAVGLAILIIALPVVVAALELGSLSMASVPAKSLSVAFSSAPRGFARFAFRVDGVAFTTTAVGKDKLHLAAVVQGYGQGRHRVAKSPAQDDTQHGLRTEKVLCGRPTRDHPLVSAWPEQA